MCLNYWKVHPNFFWVKTSVKMSKKSYYSKELSDAAKYLTWNQPPPGPTIFSPAVVMNGKYACLFQSRFIHWFIMEHRRNYPNVKYIMIRSFKLELNIFYSTCLLDTKNRTILDNWILPLHNLCQFRSCAIITHFFSI